MPNKYDKYFKILELDIQASKEDVKKAFSELSHIWHPDNYMGKPSNIQDRATRKFKKISTAYQVLNEYLSEEDSDSGAEEKTKADQERREREEKDRKQREENERLKKEEEIRRKADQERKEREEKERKQREENERLKKEEEIRRKAEQERREREEKEKEKEKANKKHQQEKSKKKNIAQDREFSWWRDFWSWALILPLLVMVLIVLVPWIEEWTADIGDKASHKVVGNTNPKTNGNKISQPESLSWKRNFRGEIIGRQGLTLNLERNGDNFKGDYIDVHEMKKKILIGKFDNKFPRNLVLEEYIDGKKSGSFYGNYTDSKEIVGEYISQSEPNNKLKFKLKEIDAPRDESRKTTSSHFFDQGLKGYKNKDYKKALERLKPLAEQGNVAAQYILSLLNNTGSNGKEKAVKYKNDIEKEMSKQQIEKAQEMARNWKPRDTVPNISNDAEKKIRLKSYIHLPEVDKFSSVKKKLDSLGSKYGIKKLDKLAAVKSEQHKDIQDNLKLVKSKALSEYVGKIYKRVYSFWKTPLGAVKKSATVSFTIFSKGNISDPIIRKSTGDRNLDSIAVTAVLDSAPFSPIPDALNKTNLKINIVFKYVPKET